MFKIILFLLLFPSLFAFSVSVSLPSLSSPCALFSSLCFLPPLPTFSTNSSQFTRVSPPMITLLSRGTRLLERADATQQSFALAARLT